MPGKLTMQLENNGYIKLYRHKIRKGRYFDIYKAPEDLQPLPWCISYRGSGHYWKTLRETLAYAFGRDFLRELELKQLERIIEVIQEQREYISTSDGGWEHEQWQK